jgi:flagellar motor switch protein FliG
MPPLGTDAKLTGRQKVAIVIIALGPKAGAEVFKHLKPEEMDELTLEIAALGPISQELKQKVINEFYETAVAQNYLTEGGLAYGRCSRRPSGRSARTRCSSGSHRPSRCRPSSSCGAPTPRRS